MPKISLSGPADLLTTIPFHLGFHPERSIVVVCFHDRRLGLMARLDAAPPPHAATAAAALLPALLREAPSSVAIIGFEEIEGETGPLADALAAAVDRKRLPLRERLVVRDGRWFGVGCSCCPTEGTPLPDEADVPAVATFVGLGRSVLPSRAELARLVEPLPARSARHDLLELAIDQWQERYESAKARHPTAPAGIHLVGAAPDAPEDGQDGLDAADVALGHELDDPSPSEFMVDEALAAWGGLMRGEIVGQALEHWLPPLVGPLRDVAVRDALIAWICPGTLALEAVAPGLRDRLELFLGRETRLSDDRPSSRFDELVDAVEDWPDDAGAWQAALVPRAIEARLEELCRLTPAAHATPLLSVFASFAWWAGDGTKAGMAVDRALEIEDDHRLCWLIRGALDHGIRSRASA